jgi:hypothetical protein
MPDDDAFANELIDLIGRHYPKALEGDAAQCGICTCKLAECLGGLLAFAYFKGDGARSAKAATRIAVNHIVDSLMGTIRRAEQQMQQQDKVH